VPLRRLRSGILLVPVPLARRTSRLAGEIVLLIERLDDDSAEIAEDLTAELISIGAR
jgi:hypothetical protein